MLRPALNFFLLYSLVCAEKLESSDGPKDEGCPIRGSVDYYGWGVRIGIRMLILVTSESLLSAEIPASRLCLAFLVARQQFPGERNHRNVGNKFNLPSCPLHHRVLFLDTIRSYSCD
jgi:hypothetical protein